MKMRQNGTKWDIFATFFTPSDNSMTLLWSNGEWDNCRNDQSFSALRLVFRRAKKEQPMALLQIVVTVASNGELGMKHSLQAVTKR
jgi:hypothetical protein